MAFGEAGIIGRAFDGQVIGEPMDVGVKYGRRADMFLVNRMEAENLPFQRAFPRLGVFSGFLFPPLINQKQD